MVSQAWEHLQAVVMQVHNHAVREEFNDLEDDDDISTSRASLRTACKMVDSDSAAMTLIRYFLFYFDLRKAQDLQQPIYGIPIASFQESRKFVPQIQLYFQEDHNDIDLGYAPVTGQISFRLMGETSHTITEADLNTFAQRVRANFCSSGGFIWKKGKVMCSYTDRERGYQFILLCRNKGEARRVIEQVLDIRNHTPDWAFMNVSENEESSARYPTIPGNQTILSRSRKKPRQRPTADVRFQYSLLHVHGLPHPIVLVDRSGIFKNPLIQVA